MGLMEKRLDCIGNFPYNHHTRYLLQGTELSLLLSSLFSHFIFPRGIIMWKTRGIFTLLLTLFPFSAPLQAQDPPAGMVLIPAGEYQMGDHHNEGESDELPVHAVNIDAFYVGTCAVTGVEYAAALNWALAQGGLIHVIDGVVYQYGGTTYSYCETRASNLKSRISWNGSDFHVVSGKESQPMILVSWYGAAAYSNWRSAMEGRTPSYDTGTWECNFSARGYRLPTEAEWEKAARGGILDPYNRYPWGDSVTTTIANYEFSGDPYEAGDHPWITPVGFYNGELHNKVDFDWRGEQTSYQTLDGVNGFGLYDIAGNVWEMCNDWMSPDYYSSSPINNPKGPVSGDDRVVRGGNWSDPESSLRCACRHYVGPDNRYQGYGFRLALGTTGAPTALTADLHCSPSSGTLPFSLRLGVIMDNFIDNYRTFAGRIDITLAAGTLLTNYRAGYTNLLPLGHWEVYWRQNLPNYGTLAGENIFLLTVMDVTPPPYNQPPFWPSGDTDTDSCTVTGVAP